MRKLLSLSVALLVVVCLSACGTANAASTPSAEEPAPITFPKIEHHPEPADYGRGALDALPPRNLDRSSPLDVDLRGYDVSGLDLRESLDSLLYASHDSRTVWPPRDRMPEGFDPQALLEMGKNPGLGVRELHKRGITGRGVGIAIIDSGIQIEHQEYVDRLRLYEEIALTPDENAGMHGAAVASIAVGKTVGVAPEADLYYIASRNFDRDKDAGRIELNYAYYAQAVRRILEINAQLPEGRKIRVISISVGWRHGQRGYEEMTAAVDEAKKAGMLVVSSCIDEVHGFKFHALGRVPLSDPDAFESYLPAMWWESDLYENEEHPSDRLLVPSGSRTTASPNGADEYAFYRQGGWSWAIPYIAGVYALAAQVEPEITPERFWALAMKTGRTIVVAHDGKEFSLGPIVDPAALIEALQGD